MKGRGGHKVRSVIHACIGDRHGMWFHGLYRSTAQVKSVYHACVCTYSLVQPVTNKRLIFGSVPSIRYEPDREDKYSSKSGYERNRWGTAYDRRLPISRILTGMGRRCPPDPPFFTLAVALLLSETVPLRDGSLHAVVRAGL